MPYKPLRRVVPLKSVAKFERSLKASNLAGAEIAAKVDLSRQMISRLRKGSARAVRLETAERIETALGVERGYLFDYTAYESRVAS